MEICVEWSLSPEVPASLGCGDGTLSTRELDRNQFQEAP